MRDGGKDVWLAPQVLRLVPEPVEAARRLQVPLGHWAVEAGRGAGVLGRHALEMQPLVLARTIQMPARGTWRTEGRAGRASPHGA
jgi:hypothetical protein